MKAVPINSVEMTLNKEAKTVGVDVSPRLLAAIRQAQKDKKDVLMFTRTGFAVVRPMRPPVDGDFESVYIMLSTGYQTFGIKKGELKVTKVSKKEA